MTCLVKISTASARVNPGARSGSPLAKKLCETANTWRRLAAPVAEWVAQALWNSSRSSAKDEQVLPARLTQRRKAKAEETGLS